MIRVTVTYPKTEGATFDHDYYKATHVPLCVSSWGTVVSAEIDKGINGPNEAAVHFTFDSLDAFQAAMGSPGTAAVMADVRQLHNDHAGDADLRDRRLTLRGLPGGHPPACGRNTPDPRTGVFCPQIRG